MISAIQFIGTQRSGSNLLRVMLNAHTRISAHHPPHLLHTFMPLLAHYGNLSEQANREILIKDCCDWVDANPVTWSPVAFSRKEMVQQCQSLIDIFCYIYKTKAKMDNASIWACKSTFNIEYADLIEEHIKPFYIYLYRDGRDVAVSFKKAIVGPKHIYAIAEKWNKEQQIALAFIHDLPADRYISISYESLIKDPSHILLEICERVGLTFEPSMMDYYKSRESLATSSSGHMWENVSKPIITTNSRKYQKELSDEEIVIFESVAGESLRQLGYTLETSGARDITLAERVRFEGEDSQLRREARTRADKADLEMRRPQDELLAMIKNRYSLNQRITN